MRLHHGGERRYLCLQLIVDKRNGLFDEQIYTREERQKKKERERNSKYAGSPAHSLTKSVSYTRSRYINDLANNCAIDYRPQCSFLHTFVIP